MKPNVRNWIAFRMILFLLGICTAAWPASSFAAEVKIANKTKNAMTLSDLIVYGAKSSQVEIILHRHFGMDDVEIEAGETKSFPTSFPVIAVATSITKNGKESELVLKQLDVRSGFQPVGWLENAFDGSELFPSIDSGNAAAPPPDGTILNFTAGLNAQLPGWFVGTKFDVDQGVALDGFTGDAVMVLSGAEIAAVPEPTSLILLSAALALLGARQRHARTISTRSAIP